MIDEDRTMQLFGYNSTELKKHSGKPIIVVCEECGMYRVVKKYAYTKRKDLMIDMCRACTQRSPVNRKRASDAMLGDKNHFFGKKHSSESRAKMSDKLSGENSPNWGRSPSPETSKKLSDRQIGDKNHNWKGGITPWRVNMINSITYKNWREAVYRRDNWTCQICYTRGGDLQSHHIYPVRDHKNDLLLFDINNGITLCEECHNITKGHEYDFIEEFKRKVGEK
jgi:hypothetical protein